MFEMGPLESGTWSFSISGPDIMPLNVELVLPHAGELDAMTVRVETLRARARDIFVSEVKAASEAPLAWGFDTPAAMRKEASAQGVERAESLHHLEGLVERAWFRPDAPSLQEVLSAEDEVKRGVAP